jgi:chitin synthase
VKGAIGETDVPEALPEFISQRRRWLNGSFFAATYAIAHVGQIMRSGHSFARKVALLGETVYNIINLVFSWFSIVSDRAARSCLVQALIYSIQGNFYLFFVSLAVLLYFAAFTIVLGCFNVFVGGSVLQNGRDQVLQLAGAGAYLTSFSVKLPTDVKG